MKGQTVNFQMAFTLAVCYRSEINDSPNGSVKDTRIKDVRTRQESYRTAIFQSTSCFDGIYSCGN